MKKSFSLLAAGVMLAAFAQTAFAVVDDALLQWPYSGTTQSNGVGITFYSRVLKTGCTGVCDPEIVACADLIPTLYYRAEGATEYTSATMALNTGDCYNPWEEYIGVIPVEALTGSQVDFYVEYEDITDSSTLTFRKHDDTGVVYTAESPAYFLLSDATTAEFTLHVTGDFHCVTPSGAGPGISGMFNGWTYQAMTAVGDGTYTYDIVYPVGSDPIQQFKFRNGDGWENLPDNGNREYTIAPGATSDSYLGYWNNEEECSCDEQPLNNSQVVIFSVDMQHQDPAMYAGGVSVQGNYAPLTWNPGENLMADQGGGLFTIGLTLPAGTLNTLEYKFTCSADGTNWSWESVDNRPECLDPDAYTTALEVQFWNNYEPPTVSTVDIDVTFQVDMNCLDAAYYAGGVSVQGGAAPLDWTSGSTLLSDADMNGIYDVTLTFPAGTALEFGHKFNFSTDGVNWNWEDNISDRMVYLNDAETTVVLDVVRWDNWMCGLDLSIAPQGANVVLSWDAVGTGYTYHIYSTDEAYTTFTLLQSTTDTSVTIPASDKGFYYVTYEMVAE